MKTKLLAGLIAIFSFSDRDQKILDLGQFSIEVPNNWEYRHQEGIDSFVGLIVGPNVKLSFDCSIMGYASHLIETPEEYAKIASRQYDDVFIKPGIIYTTGDVERVRNEELKKVKKKDRAKVRVEPSIIPTRRIYKPSPKDLERYKNADFMVELKHEDSVVVMPITVSDVVKKHNFSIDTVDGYFVKLIWPKTAGDGMTGAYFKKIGSTSNLQINGTNLSLTDQEHAIKAFRTIKINYGTKDEH